MLGEVFRPLLHAFATVPERQIPGEVTAFSGESAERQRPRVSVREMNMNNEDEMQRYINFLNTPENRIHFSNPPANIKELRALERRDNTHILAGLNQTGEIIGGLVLEDARAPQNDHMLSLVVVDPSNQNQGLGTDMMREAIDWAAIQLTFDGRMRHKLDLAIILGVKGWEKMESIASKLGFEGRHRLPEQIDIEVRKPDGSLAIERKATRRYELMLERWRYIRGLSS